ncbi:oleoyl-acyl carrier protein thioesterase [Artemisia annua]|uniref:Acyl-[acyl-carrier-protein] hydrolase n=1 Tax=Artemisia annua TaxID=35608 RepID=A0A2U1LNL1_ARTAN|nr:oleoyl-acyl carrier protein thioesterase [Artemisia annua]
MSKPEDIKPSEEINHSAAPDNSAAHNSAALESAAPSVADHSVVNEDSVAGHSAAQETAVVETIAINGCNAVTRDRIHTLTHSQSIHYTSIHRRNKGLLCSPFFERVVPVMAVRTGKQPNAVTVGLTEAAEKESIQLERLRDDGSSYKERFKIRCYEVGFNQTATIETIADLLQEVNGKSNGFSSNAVARTATMRKLHLTWVTTRMYIEIYRYPSWGDVVEIETWCQREGRIGIKRDWIIKDYAYGEVLGRATSKWVMMNVDTRRLQKVSDDVINEYLASCPKALRLAFPEDSNNTLKKIAKLEDPAAYSMLGLMPRRADLDMNKHVNNVTHIGWALESVPQEVIDTHELQSITLDFKHECQHDDIVDSLTSPEPLNVASNESIAFKHDGKNLSRFLHLLRSSSDGLEKTRCRTEWRKLPSVPGKDHGGKGGDEGSHGGSQDGKYHGGFGYVKDHGGESGDGKDHGGEGGDGKDHGGEGGDEKDHGGEGWDGKDHCEGRDGKDHNGEGGDGKVLGEGGDGKDHGGEGGDRKDHGEGGDGKDHGVGGDGKDHGEGGDGKDHEDLDTDYCIIKSHYLQYVDVRDRGDVVEIETWCQREGRIGIKRDWIIKDYAYGEVLGSATSKWVMMNVDTRRLQKVSDDDVINEYLHLEDNNSLKKIAKLEAAYSMLGLMYMNKHVNNVTHIGWALETLKFKHECQHDDIVDSLTSPEPLNVASNESIAFKQDGYHKKVQIDEDVQVTEEIKMETQDTDLTLKVLLQQGAGVQEFKSMLSATMPECSLACPDQEGREGLQRADSFFCLRIFIVL